MEVNGKTLGDIAAEIEGLECVISIISMLISPASIDINGSELTQTTVDNAFFSIAGTLRHIRDSINEWDERLIQYLEEVKGGE